MSTSKWVLIISFGLGLTVGIVLSMLVKDESDQQNDLVRLEYLRRYEYKKQTISKLLSKLHPMVDKFHLLSTGEAVKDISIDSLTHIIDASFLMLLQCDQFLNEATELNHVDSILFSDAIP